MSVIHSLVAQFEKKNWEFQIRFSPKDSYEISDEITVAAKALWFACRAGPIEHSFACESPLWPGPDLSIGLAGSILGPRRKCGVSSPTTKTFFCSPLIFSVKTGHLRMCRPELVKSVFDASSSPSTSPALSSPSPRHKKFSRQSPLYEI